MMKYYISSVLSVLFVAFLSFSVTACSNNIELKGPASTAKKVAVKKPTKKNREAAKQHTHPANNCINAVSHTHRNNKEGHLHYYHFCGASEEKSNAHTHSVTGLTGSSRHVHPNGWRKHSHH